MSNDQRETLPASEIIKQAGELERTSRWYTVDQSRIDGFADMTEDHQFIHIDPEKAKVETPFGGTIAHGFLSLSMLSSMISNCFPAIQEASMSINYGFDKVRFLNPVAAGSRIRGHIKLLECTPRKPGELLSRYQVSVEIENVEKPALIAEWLGLAILNEE